MLEDYSKDMNKILRSNKEMVKVNVKNVTELKIPDNPPDIDYNSIFNKIGIAVVIMDNKKTILDMNQSLLNLTGYKREELTGISIDKIISDYDRFMIISTEINEEIYGQSEYNEFKILTKDDQLIDVLVTVRPLSSKEHVVITFTNITKLKEKEKRISYLGYHDELTGLYNRHFLKESIARLDTRRQLPLSIIEGDLNGLKLINDAFGHKKGDQLLKKITAILNECCRQEDIIARWGGDEFVVLLPKTNTQDAEKICQRIRMRCKKKEEDLLMASIALGYATKNEPEQKIEEIFKRAENMVYKNKLEESDKFRKTIVNFLGDNLLERGYETREHIERMKELVRRLGHKLELPDYKIDDLVLLSTLHDIGKIAIEDNILFKEKSLNEEEWESIKKHTEIGYRIAQTTSDLAPIADGILYHHEWWDGSGYPTGLKGEQIPLESRIISIVDAFDVMIHESHYKKAIKKSEAIRELKLWAGRQFDPQLINLFLEEVINERADIV